MLPYKDNVIRENPLLGTYRRLFVLWLIMLLLFLLFIGLMIVSGIILNSSTTKFSQFLSDSSLYVVPFLCYISSFLSTIWQRRYWKRIEQRRFAAVRGDRSLLAIEQPVANQLDLQLPCTIKSRPGKGGILVFLGIMLVFALLLAAPPAFFNKNFLLFSPDHLHNFLVLFAIIAAVMLLLVLAIFLSPISTQKIIVTEQDLSVRAGGQKNAIRWEEARLFAMYNTVGAQKSGSVITYELSGAKDIVRWSRALHTNRFHIGIVPTIPMDEYQRQMQALNALVVARTGLPLADLRTFGREEGSA